MPGGSPVTRWVFTNPTTAETYTVPINPNAMTSPFPKRKLNVQTSTAVGGLVLLSEGNLTPKDWTFSGDIQDELHYEALRHWTYDIRQRIQVTDHFGRVISCVLLEFNPTPKRAIGYYFRHTYTVDAVVVSVGVPTVTS